MLKYLQVIKMQKGTLTTDNEIINLLKIFAIVVLVFLVFIGISKIIETDSSEPEEIVIQYTDIIVGDILNQNGEYLVLVSEDDIADLESLISATYFTVNLKSVFNKSFVGETSNLEVDDIKDIVFSETTLLSIKDNKIVSSYEGSDEIETYLKGE
jgi:hypothetical protein